MKPSILALLPDDLARPLQLLRISEAGEVAQARISLNHIRTGEDGLDHPTVHRYEYVPYPDPDIADLMVNRLVVREDLSIVPYATTEWVRSEVGLHPERRDLSNWLRASRRQPTAPWVKHLSALVRHAMREFESNPDLVIVMPDRALLSATDDDSKPILKEISEALRSPARGIQINGRPSGFDLPSLNLSNIGIAERRRGIMTRAQAVIAEAIMAGHDAAPIPRSDDIESRWKAVVDQDHAHRLVKTGDHSWCAPVAIVDDHRDDLRDHSAKYLGGRATVIMATVNFNLDPKQPDIWFDYHEVFEVSASRPIQFDPRDNLQAAGKPDAKRKALIEAINEHSLPVLEISDAGDGTLDDRMIWRILPDPVPLLRETPKFNFPMAALAYLHFCDPEAHLKNAPFPWYEGDPVAEGKGDETDKTQGGDADNSEPSTTDKSPEANEAIEHDGKAPEVDNQVGEVVQSADEEVKAGSEAPEAMSSKDADISSVDPAKDDGSDVVAKSAVEPDNSDDGDLSIDVLTTADVPAISSDADDEIPSDLVGGDTDKVGGGSEENGDDDEDKSGSKGGEGASGNLALNPTASQVGEQLSSMLQGGSAPDNGTDNEADETDDENAHEVVDQGDWLRGVLDSMTDSDSRMVEIICGIAAEKHAAGKLKGPVPAKEHLREFAEQVSQDMADLVARTTADIPREATVSMVRKFRSLVTMRKPWVLCLLAQNHAARIKAGNTTRSGKMTMKYAAELADVVIAQAAAAQYDALQEIADQSANVRAGGGSFV